jgi:hypothetical protein
MTTALTPERGMLRVLRGSTLAVVNAMLAAAAHAAGGGGLPDGALTLLLTVGIAAAGTTLADRQRGPLALLAAVTGTQVVLHLLLDGLSGHHTATPAPPGSAAMTAAHGAAVLVTAALLAGAESALFIVASALRRIAGRFRRRAAGLRVVQRPAPVPPAVPLPAMLRQLLCRVTPHRGPPLPR